MRHYGPGANRNRGVAQVGSLWSLPVCLGTRGVIAILTSCSFVTQVAQSGNLAYPAVPPASALRRTPQEKILSRTLIRLIARCVDTKHRVNVDLA